MSIYTRGDNSVNTGHLTQIETDIYGSSRLGIDESKKDLEEAGTTDNGVLFNFQRGEKVYELGNHLGNVLSTIGDAKLPGSSNGNEIVDYTPKVQSAGDYYPFGMQEPGRTFSSVGYRYGFNGQEHDREINENITTALFWEYDSRIGRRWNIDPKQKDWESPYLCFGGNPILFSDLNGDKAGNGDPTPVYHRTSSANAASIKENGFDPGKSNRNAFTYFTTDLNEKGIGKQAANANTVVEATVDLSNAKTITKQQMSGWFNDGLSAANKQFNTKYSSISQVPEALKSTYQSIADGVRYTKLADFMINDGGSVYQIGGTKSVAVSEAGISGVNITRLSGSGAAEAIQGMSRPALMVNWQQH
ncbi:hypothetical protein DCM91_20915 [Chitinophaga costaii]|nr:hypothetical protein [Chitinophaga costaii]PUZ19064.1 hypothetical protein DCM91_20915 [Chitinophaga costaii]